MHTNTRIEFQNYLGNGNFKQDSCIREKITPNLTEVTSMTLLCFCSATIVYSSYFIIVFVLKQQGLTTDADENC